MTEEPKFIKPCNDGMFNDEQTDTKMCSHSRTPCCLHCKQVKKCVPKWEDYRKLPISPRENRDKLIPCVMAENLPRWCASVLDFLKTHPNWKTEVKPEKVDFT